MPHILRCPLCKCWRLQQRRQITNFFPIKTAALFLRLPARLRGWELSSGLTVAAAAAAAMGLLRHAASALVRALVWLGDLLRIGSLFDAIFRVIVSASGFSQRTLCCLCCCGVCVAAWGRTPEPPVHNAPPLVVPAPPPHL
jgi:hypothetical protein